MRLSLIGPGDVNYHSKLLGIEKDKWMQELKEIAKVLADAKVEIVLLPDRGVCFEVAKFYKSFNGLRVIGTIPSSDKDFGIAHLKPYIEATIDGKKVFDQFIDTKDWYKQDLTCSLYGDAILLLGLTLGSLGELSYAYYLYKLFIGEKPEVKTIKQKIHLEIRANPPYPTIVYKPFLCNELPKEVEAYIEDKLKSKIYYVNSVEELKEKIEELKRQFD